MSIAIKYFILFLVIPQKHLNYIIDIIDIMCISFAFFSGLIFWLLLFCYSFYIFFGLVYVQRITIQKSIQLHVDYFLKNLVGNII